MLLHFNVKTIKTSPSTLENPILFETTNFPLEFRQTISRPRTQIFPQNSVGKGSQILPSDLNPLSLFSICSSGQGTDVVGRASCAPGWGQKNLRELNFHYSEIGQNLMESIHVAPSAVCDPANNFILKILSTTDAHDYHHHVAAKIGQCHLLHFRKNNGIIFFLHCI